MNKELVSAIAECALTSASGSDTLVDWELIHTNGVNLSQITEMLREYAMAIAAKTVESREAGGKSIKAYTFVGDWE